MSESGPEGETEGAAGTGRHFAAALSQHPEPVVATAEVVGRLGEVLPAPPSVVVLFAAGRLVGVLDDVVDTVDTILGPDVLVGGTAVGVLAGSQEIEDGDALAAWAACGIEASAHHLLALPGADPVIAGLPDDLEPESTLVVLANPYSFPVDALIERVNVEHPGVHVVGGLTSAPGGAGRNRVVLGTGTHEEGAVALLFGPGQAVPLVSQGCRPIGQPWVVTEAQGQAVRALGGRPALERLQEIIDDLEGEDRAAAARGLHVGVVANDHRTTFDTGDFLIRGVLGADRDTGAVVIGDRVEVGQVLQFQVRDEDSADRELDRLLDTAPVQARSALVFTCNGRGSHLFTDPDHDAARVSAWSGDAVAGMFCAGELGPIGGRNAIHGFTATVVGFT